MSDMVRRRSCVHTKIEVQVVGYMKSEQYREMVHGYMMVR